MALNNHLQNTTDTFTGVLTVNGDVKIRPDDKLKLSDYSFIRLQSATSANVTVANSLVYVSQSAEHYFLDDNGDLADITADTVTASEFITDGDIDVTATGKGLILTSPDGTRWRLTISNAGVLVYTSI